MATRAHVVLSEELLRAVDQVAGKRKRSRFVEEAIREKLSREELSSALRESAGALNPADYPEWDAPNKVSSWVRARRQEGEAPLARKLRVQTN